jgi:hypothetical protein
MSSLLEQALVDAKALKEAALKNAEASIIERYSEEVRSTLEQILEQDDLEMPPMDDTAAAAPPSGEIVEDVPLGASEGEELCACDDEGKESEVTINFDELAEALKTLKEEVAATTEELEENEEVDISEEDLQELLASESEGEIAEENIEEDEDITEEQSLDSLVDAIAEKLTVDMGAELSGWAGRSSEDIENETEKEMAHRRSTDVEEELKDLKKAQEELVFENSQLKEQNQNYGNVVEQLKETASAVNLSNARLLYTNRVLRNTSLNERQKDKIVEAISSAGSVTEAKIISETLHSTVEAKPMRSPQSLSEALGRNQVSVIRASRQENTTSDPIAERMKKLAGIN